MNNEELLNNVHEDDILKGDEYNINGVKYKIAGFGEVINGEYHSISSEEFNRRKRGEVSDESMHGSNQSQRHTVFIPDN